jgi:hypothetical protein
MTFTVPANQAVSYTTYRNAVREACNLPEDFMSAQAARIEGAFDMGETVTQIAEEMVLRYSLRRLHKLHKTPRELADRVVKFVNGVMVG